MQSIYNKQINIAWKNKRDSNANEYVHEFH